MFFYLSLVAADKALAGLGQCRFILCIVAGFKLGRYLYLLGGCPQTQCLPRLAVNFRHQSICPAAAGGDQMAASNASTSAAVVAQLVQ